MNVHYNEEESKSSFKSATWRASEVLANWWNCWMPGSLLWAILFTILVAILGMLLKNASLATVAQGWYSGLGSLMTFAFQVAWGFSLGITLVRHPSVNKGIEHLFKGVKSPAAAYITTIIVGCITTWFNIYIGVFIAGTLAGFFARNVKGTDIRVLATAAYATLLTWHGGFGGSIPLILNTPNNPFEKLMGGLISPSQTILATWNLVTMLLVTLAILIVFVILWPKGNQKIITYEDLRIESSENVPKDKEKTLKQKDLKYFSNIMENSEIIGVIFGLSFVGTAIYLMVTKGLAAIDLLFVGCVLSGLCLLLYRSPISFANSFKESISDMSSIIVEFPLYGGVMGIMMATGLADLVSNWIMSISTQATLPIYSFLSAGFINLFIPSGGSQWAVQAPLIIPAAKALNVSLPVASMSIAYGDAWTNAIQPFWALLYMPLVARGTSLTARQFMGFSIPVVILTGVAFIVGLLLAPVFP